MNNRWATIKAGDDIVEVDVQGTQVELELPDHDALGRQPIVFMSPDQARELAVALVSRADRIDAQKAEAA